MKKPSNVRRVRITASLVLALVGSMIGIVVPGYCQDRPLAIAGIRSLDTSPRWTTTGNLNTSRSHHTATLLRNGKVLVVGGGSGANILDSAELYDPATGTWSVTGSLNTARAYHTATLLQNGKVLVAGGQAPGNQNGAELYDPATGTWSPTGSLGAARDKSTATLLSNGKVLVAGGIDNGTILQSAELYDPAAGTWRLVASPISPRYRHTSTLLQSGKVLIAGGIIRPYDPDDEIPAASYAELYDSVTDTWSYVGTAMIVFDHTATLLPSGKVLIAGGFNFRPCGGAAPLCHVLTPRSAELFDLAAGAWSHAGSPNLAHPLNTTTLLNTGKVLVVGGLGYGNILQSAELYDPGADMWALTADPNLLRIGHTATLLHDGRVLIVGGYSSANTPIALDSAEIYGDAASWVPTGNLNAARTGHTATLLSNGKVLVVGGGGSDLNIPPDPELYDPGTGLWSVTGRLNIPRRGGHTATLLPGGKVLVVAGDTSNAPPDFGRGGTAELYDPSSGTWRLTGNLNIARSGHSATLLQNGKVLVAAGFGRDSIDSAELYDPATGAWSPTGSLKVARYWHSATLLQDGRVLVAGGSNDGDLASALSDAELYDPVAGTWSITGSLNTSVVLHTATLLQSGKVLIAGGYQPRFPGGFAAPISLDKAQLYDPASGMWSYTGNLNTARSNHTATLLPNGAVLIAGGNAWHGQYPTLQFENISSAEIFDANIGSWSNTASLNAARNRHTATLLPSGKVLAAGGTVVSPTFVNIALNSAELYGNAAPPGTIDSSFTGAWYDPAQSGHGLFVEILPGNRAFVGWFTFNPAGTQQSWFVGTGTFSGNTATITPVSLPTGGRWIPNFNPNQIVNNLWGTLTLTFTDGDHGKVDFNSVFGYGTGSMNLTRLTRPAGLSTAAELRDASAAGTIGAGFTGAWYDPAQSGHGLFVEVLPDNRMFVGWFTFNPAGTEQAWFVGVGTYSGNTATITPVSLPTGGRWIPNFDPNQIVNNLWGTLTFTFTDCNHGKVDFNSVLGYGTGNMNLTRLTQPAGLTCP